LQKVKLQRRSDLRMRLDRFVSRAAGVSRSQARAMIRCGRVGVAGSTIADVGHALAAAEAVELDGRPIMLPEAAYLMMNKPVGLLSARRDDHQATVLTLLPASLAGRVHIVGRLDKQTSGLLLLSDDGGWSHRISSPRHACPKDYLVELAEPLAADAEDRLAEGILLRGEPAISRPAELQRLAPKRVRITVTEGRYHLVRRLFAALGNRVTRLHREAVGGLALDPGLASGQWRVLSDHERLVVIDPTASSPMKKA